MSTARRTNKGIIEPLCTVAFNNACTGGLAIRVEVKVILPIL